MIINTPKKATSFLCINWGFLAQKAEGYILPLSAGVVKIVSWNKKHPFFQVSSMITFSAQGRSILSKYLAYVKTGHRLREGPIIKGPRHTLSVRQKENGWHF